MRRPGEEAPIGLILCAESSREQVELLQMHKDGITLAEYWAELRPKAELEQKLHAALLETRERLARRGELLGDLDEECVMDSRGLEFPAVTVPDVGHMAAKGKDAQGAARVFYVAATRAAQRLVVGVGGNGGLGIRLRTHAKTVSPLIYRNQLKGNAND